MPVCGYCNHDLSYNATWCPNCGNQGPFLLRATDLNGNYSPRQRQLDDAQMARSIAMLVIGCTAVMTHQECVRAKVADFWVDIILIVTPFLMAIVWFLMARWTTSE